jgi:Flp pilus assembly protein TadG
MRAREIDAGEAARGKPEKTSLLTRFLRDRRGTTAIEFVMLAIPFSLLVFAILESCVSFAAQQVLADTTDRVARELRTGQLRPGDITQQQLHDMLCKPMRIMVSATCPGLYFDLEQYKSFADAARVRIQYTADGDLDTSGFKVDPGGTGSKNMLRVFYKWPVMTDFMREWMSTLQGRDILLFASVTWQNEPY